QRSPVRQPDIVVNTDPITIQMEQDGVVTRFIQEGYFKAVENTRLRIPPDEQNLLLQQKIQAIREVGLDKHLTPEQTKFLATRLRQEAIQQSEGETSISINRINLILGENVTQKIRVEPIFGTNHYVISDDSPQTLADPTHPTAWLTKRR
ncbi:MAG: hypothetical protein NTU61_01665, partial [Candidatus Altiarchaeota archaeon]|nr:hypothetical protein [Candidatus Altiarchaeota archaeon]